MQSNGFTGHFPKYLRNDANYLQSLPENSRENIS